MPGVGQVPAAEVELFYAGRNTRTVGVFDSGAMHTAFSVEWAELLGIDNVREGQAVPITTQAGPTEIFLFQMEMAIIVGAHRNRFAGQIGFFAARRPRNILGRILIFSHYQIGFRESRQEIYLRAEN